MADNNNNPWKGLDSYNYSDNSIFYGRKNETDSLVDTIINNRFTILYGPSGVGKSSLLNAGVRPKLAGSNYFIVDISMRQIDLMSNQTISSQILKIVRTCADEEHIDITPLSKAVTNDFYEDSLWYFFYTNEFWSLKNELLIPIVIIDQFEDIFKDEVRVSSSEQFFNNLDELSNGVPPISMREDLLNAESFRYNQSADFRFVFSLREDYLPRLDDYVYSLNIPELRKSRYSITLMDKDQALEVILGPANGIVSDNVANKIISILSAQNSHSSLVNRIEPFILSLFMYRLYIEMTKRGLSSISEELINKVGADIVNDFYVESMKKVSSKAMRHLEKVLLTPKGHRDSISYDKLMESEKVTDEELKTLLDDRIIKKNTVNGVDRFEFTHDILSIYAQKNKEKREQNNKSQLIIGYIGTFVTLLLASFVGWIMSPILTYISIPILIVAAVICSIGIFRIKLTSKRRALALLATCGLLGICIDSTQVIPSIGYFMYILVGLASLYLLYKLSNLTFNRSSWISKCCSIAFVWVLSFLVIPVTCFGYNVFKGMNYTRGQNFGRNVFYIKDGHGLYGLRNRMTIILEPQFDDTIKSILYPYDMHDTIKFERAFITKANNRIGVIDTLFHTIKPAEYDSIAFDIDNNENHLIYFYIDGREITETGIDIKWQDNVSPIQKRIIRKIINNMVFVQGGTFMMGTDTNNVKMKGYRPINGEQYLHEVTLSDYYISKYEVTIEDWIVIMGYDCRTRVKMENADTIKASQHPVYNITYGDCCMFAQKISELTDANFDLPTEAQWEYAARGGHNKKDAYAFSGSNFVTDVGWVGLNSKFTEDGIKSKYVSHPVGQLRANSLGLYDMTGNVTEFCKDYMDVDFYKDSKGATDPCCNKPKTLKPEDLRVVTRGGSYQTDQKENYYVTRRTKARFYPDNTYRYPDIGFRLALNPHN